MVKKHSIDIELLIVVITLLASGIVMVFSASSVYAYYNYDGDSYYVLKRQLAWAFLGLIAMTFMANYKYHRLQKFAVPLLIVSGILLLLVFVPGIGIKVNDSLRWIGTKSMRLQPSELAKISIIIFLASGLSKRKDVLKYFVKGLLPYLTVVGAIAGLILIEPHLSSAAIIVIVGAVILFVAGAKISHFLGLSVLGLAAIATAIAIEPYRLDRIQTYMNPWLDRLGEGYQITQSLMAIGSGGLVGLGLGMSRQKQLYLPEAHNDFVFSIIGEELGFLGATMVILLFLIFIWKGIKVAVHAPDMFGSLLATGITSLIAIQAMINIAVVTASIPNTGQPLPFFSYGGSSMVFLLASVGILLNISRYSKYDRG